MDNKELYKAIAEVAKTAGNAPGGKSAFAELLIQMVEPNHIGLDLFSAFMPVRQASLNDVNIKRVRRGKYSVQSMVPGTAHLVSQPTTVQDYHSYVFDRLIGGVRESLWNVQEGSHITVNMMRQQLQLDLTDHLVTRVFNLISSVWNDVNTPSHYVEGAAITANALDELIENVMYTAGNVRAIIGTRRALRPLYEFAGWREYAYVSGSGSIAYPISDKLMEYLNTNRVTAYKGVPVIELPQVFANQLPNLRQPLIPEDKITLVGENAGEILMYGDTTFQEHVDNTIQPPDYVLHAYMQYGMVVDMPENIGIFKIV
jgi:hypothetical protein